MKSNKKKIHFDCPNCGSADNYVATVIVNPESHKIKRHRRCNNCKSTFKTFQKTERLDMDGYLWRGVSQSRPGAKNGGAVFTDQNVIDMRKLRNDGMTLSELAKIFGCGRSTVHRIVRRESYKNVA